MVVVGFLPAMPREAAKVSKMSLHVTSPKELPKTSSLLQLHLIAITMLGFLVTQHKSILL